MADSLTWPRLEAALASTPRWRRTGREWHGPCPVTGEGRNTCWFGPGDRAEVRGGCRRCGTRLNRDDFFRHIDVLLGREPAAPGFAAPRRRAPRASGDLHRLPGALWAAASPLLPGGPGLRYLAAHRRVVAAADGGPPAVRWLSYSRAADIGCRPRLPLAAAGALIYRFAAVGEEATAAVQLEALSEEGAALRFGSAGKRPSVAGSLFEAGARVFTAAAGEPGCGCWLVEGPLDALALVRLGELGLEDLKGAAVFGVAGAPAGYQIRACGVSGPVVLAPDVDPAGDRSVLRLGAELGSLHWPYRVRRPVPGLDWSDMVLEAVLESEMLDDRQAAS